MLLVLPRIVCYFVFTSHHIASHRIAYLLHYPVCYLDHHGCQLSHQRLVRVPCGAELWYFLRLAGEHSALYPLPIYFSLELLHVPPGCAYVLHVVACCAHCNPSNNNNVIPWLGGVGG